VSLDSGQSFVRIIISLFNQAQLFSLRLIQARFHTEREKQQLAYPSMNKPTTTALNRSKTPFNQADQDMIHNSSQPTSPSLEAPSGRAHEEPPVNLGSTTTYSPYQTIRVNFTTYSIPGITDHKIASEAFPSADVCPCRTQSLPTAYL